MSANVSTRLCMLSCHGPPMCVQSVAVAYYSFRLCIRACIRSADHPPIWMRTWRAQVIHVTSPRFPIVAGAMQRAYMFFCDSEPVSSTHDIH